MDAHYFPNMRVRRGIWLDARDDGALASIAEKIRETTSSFGIVPESRKFVAHITIARLKNFGHGKNDDISGGDRFPYLQKLLVESKLTVERFFPTSVALFESTLNPGGSSYRILREFPLQHSQHMA